MKPTVLFFARDYQAFFFPALASANYRSVYATLNKKEKQMVLNNGGEDVICFEEEFDKLPINEVAMYLRYSLGCDRHYVGLNMSERELVLKKTTAFWRKVLDSYRPDLIINETVAIEVSEVLMNEAEKRNIRCLTWMSFPKKNTFYWQVSPFHNSLKPVLDNIIPSQDQIEEARSFVAGVKEGVERPFYVHKLAHRRSLYILAKNIWSILLEIPLKIRLPKVKRVVFYGTAIRRKTFNIKLFFLSLFAGASKYDNINDYTGKEKVFYPLHFEPEAVLFYMAYFFENQVTVIENVLKCLDVNQVMVVKEHPQQAGRLLERKFRKIKERYPNLIFIRGEEPTIKILNACEIVVTLGSTAGFESLVLGKKVINLGRVFYDSFEGTNNCKSFSEIYDLLRGNVPFKAPSDFSYFVAKMLSYLKPGNPFFHAQLFDADNINAIKKAIENELAIQD